MAQATIPITPGPAPAAEPKPPFNYWPLAGCAVVVFATLIAYANTFNCPFLFDDLDAIVNNTAIRSLPTTGDDLFRYCTRMRPTVELTLWMNYSPNARTGEVRTLDYHLTNLTIHILAACALLGLVRRMLLSPRLRERWGGLATPVATAVALLWALHPLQTESVTYVIQRAESLMGLFYLVTLYCSLRGLTASWPLGGETLVVEPRGRKWWFVAAVAACSLGMGSKQVMVTAPIMVLLLDAIFVSRSFRKAVVGAWPLYAGLAATWAILAAMLKYIPTDQTIADAATGFTWQSYFATQIEVVAYYLRLCFWPSPLCLDYGWPVAKSVAIAPAVLLGLILAGTVAGIVLRHPAAFLGAWLLGILAPTSSFMPIADAAFEHRMYLPLAAVVAAVVVAAAWVILLVRTRTKLHVAVPWAIGGVAAAAVAAVLLTVTWQRNMDYASVLGLWQQTAAVRPDNSRARGNYGQALLQTRDVRGAIAEFDAAIALMDTNAQAWNNRGSAYAQLARAAKDTPEKAKSLYEKALTDIDHAIAVEPGYIEAYNNRGSAHMALAPADPTHWAKAVEAFNKAIELNPKWAGSYYNRSVCYFGLKQYDKAWADLHTCIAKGGRPSQKYKDDLVKASGRMK